MAVILFFTATGFILYYPVLGNTFLSDDYDSLYRIYIEKRILYREFFRPMIDISFYFNYLVSGTSPGSFYIFNLVVHIINALLLFRFTQRIGMAGKKDQFLFGAVSAFLFLIYPFHNESISWLSGRLSSMACLFALLSMVLSREKSGGLFIFLSIVCYLIGLLCYESIIVLPLIIIVLNRHQYKSAREIISYSLYWVCTAGIYLLTRLLLSGEITGSYASHVTDSNVKEKVLNTGKVLGRLFLPPSGNQALLTGLTVVLFILLIAIHRYLFKNKIIANIARFNYLSVLTCLAISLLVPVAFGVSTRTSEGDRLLYFPSCFLCILAAGSILALYKKPLNRWLVLTVITFYCTWFLELNNLHWVKASGAAQAIMDVIKNKGSRNIIFINMPDELEGAFVFRNGFRKALVINQIDTGSVKIFNYLKRPDYLKTGSAIVPVVQDSVTAIFPFTRVMVKGEHLVHITSVVNNESLTVEKEGNLIYYWNKEQLVRLF